MTSNEQELEIEALAHALGVAARRKGAVAATAESCTAGGIAAAVTEVAGSSAWMDRGFVTYTNRAKVEMLGVVESTLEKFGAVSEPTVEEMARGALERSCANIAAAVSGIAGPSGAVPGKPVGTVCFGFARRSSAGDILVRTHTMHFEGERHAVRRQTVRHALAGLIEEAEAL